MTIRLAYQTVDLDAASARSVHTVRGARIRVVRGLVWATTSGDTRDVWLRDGDELTVARNGRTVLESNARSTIELLPPRADGVLAHALFQARVQAQQWWAQLSELRWQRAEIATVTALNLTLALAFAAGIVLSHATGSANDDGVATGCPSGAPGVRMIAQAPLLPGKVEAQ